MSYRNCKAWSVVLSAFLLLPALSFAQTGQIGSNVSKCFIPTGAASCPVEISWTTSGASNVCVWRIHNSLSPAKWKCMANGDKEEFGTVDASGRVFELRRNSSGSYESSVLMDSISVLGTSNYSTEFGNGSSYAWHQIDSSGCGSNNPASRVNHVVLRNYHIPLKRTEIQSHILAMAQSGQDMIRIPIYHARCGAIPDGDNYSNGSCSAPNRHNSSSSASDSGQLPSLVRQNLKDLIEYSFQQGINTVLVGFFPGHENRVIDWHSISSDLLEENWSVIKSTRDYLDGNLSIPQGKKVLWELGNEMVPAPNLANASVRVAYMSEIWSRWVSFFGASDSVGFSIISSSTWHIENRIPYIQNIYGGIYPLAVDLHLYGCPGASDASCREDVMYVAAREVLDGLGLGHLPIAIGESLYNDATASENIKLGVSMTNELPLYVIQWVRARGDVSNCFVAPPSDTELDIF